MVQRRRSRELIALASAVGHQHLFVVSLEAPVHGGALFNPGVVGLYFGQERTLRRRLGVEAGIVHFLLIFLKVMNQSRA